MGLGPGWLQTGIILSSGGAPLLANLYKNPKPPVTSGKAGWTAGSMHPHHALLTSQVWEHTLIHTLAGEAHTPIILLEL